jgi:hypothetical protein
MDQDQLAQSVSELLQRCRDHMDNALIQNPSPEHAAQARELKTQILQLQIRLNQRRLQGNDFDEVEAAALGRLVPALAASLPPHP